jgi:hypothetical protein
LFGDSPATFLSSLSDYAAALIIQTQISTDSETTQVERLSILSDTATDVYEIEQKITEGVAGKSHTLPLPVAKPVPIRRPIPFPKPTPTVRSYRLRSWPTSVVPTGM